ncbi:hypothetical protein BDV93DRAFT_565415 [Ceratobasidium sp. AG-I]|nr:hypothetical protein BDV93DRAFT_565415 [Ceratobasidium sp. AG-I]
MYAPAESFVAPTVTGDNDSDRQKSDDKEARAIIYRLAQRGDGDWSLHYESGEVGLPLLRVAKDLPGAQIIEFAIGELAPASSKGKGKAKAIGTNDDSDAPIESSGQRSTVYSGITIGKSPSEPSPKQDETASTLRRVSSAPRPVAALKRPAPLDDSSRPSKKSRGDGLGSQKPKASPAPPSDASHGKHTTYPKPVAFGTQGPGPVALGSLPRNDAEQPSPRKPTTSQHQDLTRSPKPIPSFNPSSAPAPQPLFPSHPAQLAQKRQAHEELWPDWSKEDIPQPRTLKRKDTTLKTSPLLQTLPSFQRARDRLAAARSSKHIYSTTPEGDKAAEPAVANPVVVKSVIVKPAVTKPAVAKPVVVTKPIVTKPVVTKSVIAKPIVAKPTATNAVITKPAPTRPAAAKPAISDPPIADPPIADPPVADPPSDEQEAVRPGPAKSRQVEKPQPTERPRGKKPQRVEKPQRVAKSQQVKRPQRVKQPELDRRRPNKSRFDKPQRSIPQDRPQLHAKRRAGKARAALPVPQALGQRRRALIPNPQRRRPDYRDQAASDLDVEADDEDDDDQDDEEGGDEYGNNDRRNNQWDPEQHPNRTPTVGSFNARERPTVKLMIRKAKLWIIASGTFNWRVGDPGDADIGIDAIVARCFARACRERGQRFPLVAEHITCVKNLVTTFRHTVKATVIVVVEKVLDFIDGDRPYNRKLSKWLLPDRFHEATPEVPGDHDPFESKFIFMVVARTLFGPGELGVKHAARFSPVPVRFLAFICSICNHVIYCYRRGSFVYDEHLKSIVQEQSFHGYLVLLDDMQRNREVVLREICAAMYDQGRTRAGHHVVDPVVRPPRRWAPDANVGYIPKFVAQVAALHDGSDGGEEPDRDDNDREDEPDHEDTPRPDDRQLTKRPKPTYNRARSEASDDDNHGEGPSKPYGAKSEGVSDAKGWSESDEGE